MPSTSSIRVRVDAVFGFAVRRCRNPVDVADLVSTVFVALFSAAPGYDARRGDARPWLRVSPRGV